MLATRPAVVVLDLALPGLSGLGGVPDVQAESGARLVLLASSRVSGKPCSPWWRRPGLLRSKHRSRAAQEGRRGRAARRDLDRPVRRAAPAPADHLADPGRFRGGAERALAEAVRLSRPARARDRAPRRSGVNNREIATGLSITESTVKAHLTSVFRKLDVPDRLRLALFVRHQRAPAAARRAPSRAARPSTGRRADARPVRTAGAYRFGQRSSTLRKVIAHRETGPRSRITVARGAGAVPTG